MSESTPVHDPRVLRAIAHPVRYRILDELSAAGPARAADLAADLGIPANQASFHLRQLAKYGVVVEAPEAARDKRDRVWKVAHTEGLSINLRELEQDPGTASAGAVWRRSASARVHRVVDAAFATDRHEEGWPHRLSDHTLRLSPDEARELGRGLEELVNAWGERTRGRDPGRRTYLLTQILLPYPETEGPETEGPDTDETSASS